MLTMIVLLPMKIYFLTRLLDFIAPRMCLVCGRRLSPTEEQICLPCIVQLPRTLFSRRPLDNKMARQFWGLMPIERAAALFFFEPHGGPSKVVYSLKYGGNKLVGLFLGRMTANEMMPDGFFEGIDMIVPIPLAKKRLRQRGYNQSEIFARGLGEATGIPVNAGLVARKAFRQSQTKLGRWERMDNVKDMFVLKDSENARNKHVLLVDDIITTGATVLACAEALKDVEGIKISVLSLGFTKS